MMHRREGDSETYVHARVTKLEEEMLAYKESIRLHFVEHAELMVMVKASIESVKETGQKMATSMSEIAEVVKIYNQGRGAFEITRGAGKFILWLASIIVGLSAIVAAIKYWVMA